MSRAQQTDVYNTEQANSATNESAAQTADKATQADIGNQQSQLAKFAAANPYVQGGQAQTVVNQQLAGTADATAAAAAEKNQQQAERTGQNSTAGVAAGEAEQQAAQRTLGTQEAGATQSRLAAGSQYGQDVLGATGQITAAQQNLATQESNAAQGQAGTEEQAAQTPSFLDSLGTSLVSAGAQLGSAAITKCWIAAELYNGWDDPRVHTLRAWLFGPFRETWMGWRLTQLYIRYGVRAAALIRRSRVARAGFKVVFDRALKAAQKWQAGG